MRIVEWSGVSKKPGATQHGCMFTSIIGEDFDTVYVYNTKKEALKDVESYRKRGAQAKYVTRILPDWEDTDV